MCVIQTLTSSHRNFKCSGNSKRASALSIFPKTARKGLPLRAVFGNIDSAEARLEFPEHLKFRCEDVKVWITHIGGYPGRYAPAVREMIKVHTPNLFICGHSHILKVMNDKRLNLLHMNPGAVGTYGIHNVRTMLRFEISGDKIQNLEVIEFKRNA